MLDRLLALEGLGAHIFGFLCKSEAGGSPSSSVRARASQAIVARMRAASRGVRAALDERTMARGTWGTLLLKDGNRRGPRWLKASWQASLADVVHVSGEDHACDDESAQRLAELCPRLKRVSLPKGPISDTGVAALATVPTLQHVDLGGCRGVTDAGVLALSSCRALRHLVLRSTSISDSGLAYLGSPQVRPASRRSASQSSAAKCGQGGGGSLRYVNLANTAVGDHGVSLLIENNPGLRTLILQSTRITDEGLCCALGGVRSLKKLRVLDLSYCRVSDVTLTAAAACCALLEELVVRCCRRVTLQGVLKVATAAELRTLDLWGCGAASDADVVKLADVSPKLHTLSLRGCGVGNTAVTALARGCPLRALDLSGCHKITDEAVELLARLCPSLAKLDLWGCLGVTQASVQVLWKECYDLRQLHLYGALETGAFHSN